jgi:hypothetical protein
MMHCIPKISGIPATESSVAVWGQVRGVYGSEWRFDRLAAGEGIAASRAVTASTMTGTGKVFAANNLGRTIRRQPSCRSVVAMQSKAQPDRHGNQKTCEP